MSQQKHLVLPTITLIVGFVLLLMKFIAWWWTNSNAILTDALESIINVVAGGFALYSLSFALKPSDHDHPYGHGKIEFISAGFEGALILVAGIVILFKSIWDMFHPHEVVGLDLGLAITGFSGLVNYIMGHFLEKKGKTISSLTLEASGEHLKTDAYSSLALLIGLGIVWMTDIFLIDNIIAILFGVFIVYTGYGLVRKSVAGIMDEADEQLIRDFVNEIEQHRLDDWIDVHNLRVIQYGNSLHMDCHLTLPWYYTNKQSHDAMKVFEDTVKELSNRPIELFVHVDPCEPHCCSICQKNDCSQRKTPSEKRIQWNLENITKNKKHST